MKIYSMTATFGKLEHQTLTLQPGLNIIHAPNEWGKSTWCAFLVTMLYGLNTSERSKTGFLADKDHYAPWSGSPMSGRIDLCWQGRDITIQRSSTKRVPLGEFRAYETASGLSVPELTAANCGQVLLGVERSVFVRSGFLRFSDLPVTNDDELRHRLDALVTTGDESGQTEALAKKLNDLKNRCRHNKTGLLPTAEGQARDLEKKLSDLNDLNDQAQALCRQRSALEQERDELEAHKQALRYAAAQQDALKVRQAAEERDRAQARCEDAEAACAGLPSRDDATAALAELDALRPTASENDGPSLAQAQADAQELERLTPAKSLGVWVWLAILLGIVCQLVGTVLWELGIWIPHLILRVVGVVLIVWGIASYYSHRVKADRVREKRQALIQRHGSDDPAQWIAQAAAREAQAQKLAQRPYWDQILAHWTELDQAQTALQQASQYLDTLQSMAKTAPAPTQPDRRTETAAQTEQRLTQIHKALQKLQHDLGNCQGKMELLGSRDAAERELEALRRRIEELELTYRALDRSLKALACAKAELQRRFAPRICQQAQDLFGRLTHGRYRRMTLAEDLSIQAGAEGEDILRSPLYRSDGTVDQLYLALRLAVARELTPQAPLILDDALIRFDGDRLAAALEILRQEAQQKQVILFTCQGREQDLCH